MNNLTENFRFDNGIAATGVKHSPEAGVGFCHFADHGKLSIELKVAGGGGGEKRKCWEFYMKAAFLNVSAFLLNLTQRAPSP